MPFEDLLWRRIAAVSPLSQIWASLSRQESTPIAFTPTFRAVRPDALCVPSVCGSPRSGPGSIWHTLTHAAIDTKILRQFGLVRDQPSRRVLRVGYFGLRRIVFAR